MKAYWLKTKVGREHYLENTSLVISANYTSNNKDTYVNKVSKHALNHTTFLLKIHHL